MNFFHRRSKSNTQNIYSAAHLGENWYRLPSIRSMIFSLCCFAIIIFVAPLLFYPPKGKAGNSVGNLVISSSSSRKHRCWLKHALKSGEFKLFSHRSYHDNTQSEQPTCHDSLSQLKSIGVNHLDLDLVLDERHETHQLVVAHPMEFKRQSDHYSPCANTGFDEMIQALKMVYGDDFFISVEPKAAWGKTQKELDDVALSNLPSTILEELLKKIEQYELKGKCAAMVEINDVQDDQELGKERRLLEEILQHCELFRVIRLSDDFPTSMGDHDIIMPTIEFHPSHARNTAKVIPRSLRSKSIFWVVDSQEDLAMAADMHPFGIVSNSPNYISQIVEDSSWCDESSISIG